MRRTFRLMMTSSFIIFLGAGGLLLREIPFHAWNVGNSQSQITTLFPPDDDVYAALHKLMDAETKRLYIAAYRLTDSDIARIVCNAAQRGVDVQIVADAGALEARYNRVLEMLSHGVAIYVFPPIGQQDTQDEKRISKAALMHNKFMLFESSSTVWTGSFNFTAAARNTNQENVIILRNQHHFHRYRDYFSVLKRRSTALTKLFRNIA